MDFQDNTRTKTIFIALIIIFIVDSIIETRALFKTIKFIKKSYIMYPQKIFGECYLSQKLFETLTYFENVLFDLDFILVLILPFINYFINNEFNLQIYFRKYGLAFGYFNYLIVGPFLLGTLIISFKHYDKVMKICINNNPEEKRINFSNIFFSLFILIISIIGLFGGIYYYEFFYFINTIKLKKSGNYIVGVLFWLTAFKIRYIRSNNNEINENNLEDGILDNIENNQNENQNPNLINII